MMKGMFKKALAGIAAAALAATGFAAATTSAMADPATAVEPSITLTGDVAGRTFTAYKLGSYVTPQLNAEKTCVSSFSLEQSEEWLEPSISTAVVAAAQEAGETIPDSYSGSELAWVATLDTVENSDLLRTIANSLANSLVKPEDAVTATADADDDAVVLNVAEDGWYLVTDTKDGETTGTPILVGTKVQSDDNYLPLCSAGGSTGTASVKPLTTSTPDKEVTEGSEDGTVTVGDEVTFEITNTIPNTTGYETYSYQIVDMAGAGLRMPTDGADYTVMVGKIRYQYYSGTGDTPDSGYYFTLEQEQDTDGSTTTTIVLNDVTGMDGQIVTVSYTATVVDDEEIWNKAQTDNSGWGDPVVLLSGGFKFTKTDADGNALDGAEFVVMKDGKYLQQNADGLWNFVEKEEDATSFEGENGVFEFSGLEAGDYTVIETKVPDGYLSTVKAEFTVTITETGAGSGYYLNEDAENAHSLASTVTVDNGEADWDMQEIHVMNVTSITQLPQTGAAGIAMFVVIGLLIAGVGVTVYMKSRNVRNAMRG